MSLEQTLLTRAHSLVGALGGVTLASVADAATVSTPGLLQALSALGELARGIDALRSVLSSEFTRRTQTDATFRREVLGGDVGGRFADDTLRDLTRLSDDVLRDWERVGAAIAPRVSLQGEALPCAHEHLAQAVLGAAVTARSAAIVAQGLDAVAFVVDTETLAELELTLLDYAGSLTVRELARLTRALPDRFLPDGAEPREEALRRNSKVTVRELPNGMTRLVAELHPEAGGFVKAALDACTAPRRQPRFEAAGDPIIEDRRPLAERRVDALTTIARSFLAHDTGTLAGTSVTLLVTVPLETLQSGRGVAQLAGVDEPVSAATARRLATQAEIIPVVLGAESEVLDLGRSARLFSEPQRRALAARDGGCVWPGCHVPPAWCEVAHLTAWVLGGTTDLDNGALMCSAHHRRFDHDGWQLRREHGVPYLIPPPWLDPHCTARRAGRMLAPV